MYGHSKYTHKVLSLVLQTAKSLQLHLKSAGKYVTKPMSLTVFNSTEFFRMELLHPSFGPGILLTPLQAAVPSLRSYVVTRPVAAIKKNNWKLLTGRLVHLKVNLHCSVNELVTFQSLRRKEGEDRTTALVNHRCRNQHHFNTESSFIARASLEKTNKHVSSTLTFHNFKACRWPSSGQVHGGTFLHW